MSNLRGIWVDIDGVSTRVTCHMDKFRRTQRNLKLEDLFPTKKGICCCGCYTPLTGKQKRWAGPDCNSRAMAIYSVINGSSSSIRSQLSVRDNNVCAGCGLVCENDDEWQADHIIPVHKGGGACNLDNFQTLCIDCHKNKTKTDNQ